MAFNNFPVSFLFLFWFTTEKSEDKYKKFFSEFFTFFGLLSNEKVKEKNANSYGFHFIN